MFKIKNCTRARVVRSLSAVTVFISILAAHVAANELASYQTLDTRPAPVLSPEQALEAFQIAPGFEIELVAAEPLVEDPVAAAWDEYGRMYVVEMRGFMPDAYGKGSDEPVGQIVRLEDRDGDGRMDHSAVFLDKLVNPRAVAVVNEGVLVGEPPHLWLCELSEPDAICENKSKIGVFGADTEGASVEHKENGLMPGLDNWYYNAKSARSLRLKDGKLQERQGFFRGQWGITKDNVGRLFYNHNSTWLQADLFAAEDLVLPGNSGNPPGLGIELTPSSEVFSIRVNPGVNRAYIDGTLREDGRLHKATAVSGLVAYRGEQFPQEFSNDLFVPEPAGNVVAQFNVEEQGLALSVQHRLYPDKTWGQREFLGSTDERFRPVDALNGPDGALYIIDMYRGIVQDKHFLTDELRAQIVQRKLDTPIGMGRIWRIQHKNGEIRRDRPNLAEASSSELVAALRHQNGWVRDTAQRLLLASDDDLGTSLAEMASADNTLAAIHAVWTLEGRGDLRRETVLNALEIDDSKRQVQLLRAGRGALKRSDLVALGKRFSAASEDVRTQLAYLLGDHAQHADVRKRLQLILLSGLDSPYVRQAVIRAAHNRELVFLTDILSSDQFNTESPGAAHSLQTLAANAYRSLRGDLSSDAAANPNLLDLLKLVQSQEHGWQQIAMLNGIGGLTTVSAFQPAPLADIPPLFAESDISEQDPLWKAMLSGRRAFTWPGDELAKGLTPLSAQQKQTMAKGEAFYPKCAVCHGVDGGGTTGLAPPLAGVSWVTGPPEWLGRIILQGMSGPLEINDVAWNGVMPPHQHLADLDDATLAGLMTFMRRSWGNTAGAVDTELATTIRKNSAQRQTPWTSEELQRVPFYNPLKRFVGTFSMPMMALQIVEDADGLTISFGGMADKSSLNQLSDTVFTAVFRGQEARLEFIVDDDNSINSLTMDIQGQKVPLKRTD